MTKSICIISGGYPTKDNPEYAFIQPLAWAMADAGAQCSVIAPQSVTERVIRHKKKRPYKWTDKSPNGGTVSVYQPDYVSASKLKLFDVGVSTYLRDRSIIKCFKKEKISADVLYGHFWNRAMAACKLAKMHPAPVYAVSGESKISLFSDYGKKDIDALLPMVKGVICVSTKNLDESRDLGLLLHNPEIAVIPNAVNPSEFYKMPKDEAREKLGIGANERVAVFVGAFCERKGVLRTVEAVEKVPDLKLILIGSGEQKPQSGRIIFSGRAAHNEIAKYLNAADMFVLPTLAEGCCNAVVEAMACGLPIVSSNLPFNDDVLDENNSIRINPKNIDEIADALRLLSENAQLREKLSQGSLRTAAELVIDKRCEKIMNFMNM